MKGRRSGVSARLDGIENKAQGAHQRKPMTQLMLTILVHASSQRRLMAKSGVAKRSSTFGDEGMRKHRTVHVGTAGL